MIVIKDKHGYEHKYQGDIILNYGDEFITVCCNFSTSAEEYDLAWTGNMIDGFYPEDIEFIRGEYDKKNEEKDISTTVASEGSSETEKK